MLSLQPDVFMRHQPIIGLALAAAAAISTDIPPTPTPAPAAGGGSSSTTTSSTTSVPPVPVATLWERLAGYERQLLLTLPDGTQGREMLVAMLLEAVQAAHPQQVGLCLCLWGGGGGGRGWFVCCAFCMRWVCGRDMKCV